MRSKTAYATALVLALGVVASVGLTRQQDKSQRPSPSANAQCSFTDGKTIGTAYSSPRMKGRKIFASDGLVPYGKVWRAGANEATTFVTTADLTVGGKDVAAGSYTLFAIPSADKWTLIISKKTGEWGIPYPGEQYDLARVDMTVTHLTAPTENFLISYNKSNGGCTLNLEWEQTRASVTFKEKM